MPVQQVAVREIGLDRELGGRSAVRLSRPVGQEGAAGRRHSAAVRRRQIVLGLGVLAAIALLAAIESGAATAWWVALCIIALGCAYLALVRRLGRVRIEREFAAMFDSSSVDLSRWSDVRLASSPSHRAQGPTTSSEPMRIMRELWALARFGLANLAGWLLAPVVFALTLLLGETPQDSTGQRWLANIKAAQARLADQSLRTLAISAATTASVTAVGTVAAVAGTATTASAASPPASIGILAGPGLVNGPTSTYRVVAGDTLSAIAARFGTTVASLAAINHLSNPNLIFAGQVLTISGSAGGGGTGNAGPAGTGGSTATTRAPAASGTTYRVVAGDTLSAIAARFGTTAANLAAINHLANPNLIFAGQVLTISGSAAGGGTGNAGPAGTGGSTATTRAPAASGTTYRVVAGDTLSAIAARFGTTAANLAALNHLANPNLIFAGEVLTISGTSGQAAAPAPTSEPTPAPRPAPTSAPLERGGDGRPSCAGPSRQALRVRGGRAQQLRLFRAGHVRVGAGGRRPPPLLGGAVRGHRADLGQSVGAW